MLMLFPDISSLTRKVSAVASLGIRWVCDRISSSPLLFPPFLLCSNRIHCDCLLFRLSSSWLHFWSDSSVSVTASRPFTYTSRLLPKATRLRPACLLAPPARGCFFATKAPLRFGRDNSSIRAKMCKSTVGVSATKELSTHDDKACNTVIRLFGRTIPISSGDEILHAAAGRPAKSLKSETDPQFKISASTIKSEDEEDHHPTTCFNKSKDSDDERPAAAPSVSLKGVTGASTNSLTNDETESSCAKSLSVEQQQRKRAEPEPETEESAVAVVAPSRCGGPGAGAVACPRCNSMETKFCYFNNYNVNQPRHFCRSCRRYWTAGGTIRNIPVGAGRRKSKHFHFQAAAAAAAAAATAAAPPCPAPALPSIMNATIPAAGVADFLNGLVYRGLKACESGSVSGSGPDSAARSIPAIQSKSFSQSQRSNFAFGISKLGPQ